MRIVSVMALIVLVAGAPLSLSILPAKAQSPGDAPSRVPDAPVTNCDTYAASDLDTQRKTKGVSFEKVNSALAIPACESAVRQYPNSPRLNFQLGRAYSKINDFSSALIQYRKAADQGYAPAQYNLGVVYERAQAVRQDDAQAVVWYRKAAEQGYVDAQFNLGNMYARGQGVSQNYAEAIRWWRRAGDHGDTKSQISLGDMYSVGRGVPEDNAEAVRWWRKAADQGSTDAQYKLGVNYFNQKDYAEAGRWFLKERDYVEAAKSYQKAADQGNVNAKNTLADIFARFPAVRQRLAEETLRAVSPAAPQTRFAVQQSAQTPTGIRLIVAIETSISGGARPIIRGTTNLPDGTRLFVWLKKPWLANARERLAAGLAACEDDCIPLAMSHTGLGDMVTVKNGEFVDGPITDKGAVLHPGRYVLEVTSPYAFGEPENVRKIIGDHGENMAGPLIGGCCFADPRGPTEIQKSSESYVSDATVLGASIYYARSVEIVPQQAASPTPAPGRE